MGENRNAHRILVGKPEGMRLPGIPRCILWECNIKISLHEIGWEIMGWSPLAQDRDHWQAVGNTVAYKRVKFTP
jgi:hypothetical protein